LRPAAIKAKKRAMMNNPARIWLCPDQVFDGVALRQGTALAVSAGVIEALCPVASLPPRAHRERLRGTLVPGYLDLQVNGGGGALLNAAPTPETILTIAAAHRRFGTVGLLPTVITDRAEVLDRAVAALHQVWGAPGILGLHIEGPHISVARKGTHAAEFIRPLDAVTIAHVASLRQRDIPVMITLAPEATAPGQIAALAAMGAVVSLGHSDATAEDVRAALAEGATCFTHLFNAMSPLINRAPGVTGAAINSTAYAGVICDGHHVADENVAMAVRARPVEDRMFLVSDAMPTVGGPDRFTLYGHDIRLSDGKLVNTDGSLAGAHVTMADSVTRAINVLGLPIETVLRMGITVPATVIGQTALARLEGRRIADLLLLTAGWTVASDLATALR
jgi:N-acetylglucosamine-6-phosphate deacetylase